MLLGRSTGWNVTAVLATLAALVSPATAYATFPGANGRIAFVRYHPATRRDSIYTVRPNGSGLLRLTRGHDDLDPAWSPNGRRIAFSRDGNIWVMGARGRHVHQVTKLGGTQPAWSADGETLAFTSSRAGNIPNIYEIGSTRPYGHVIPITSFTPSSSCGYQGDTSPAFGPDGSLWWTENCPPPDRYPDQQVIERLLPDSTTATLFAKWTGNLIDIAPNGDAVLSSVTSRDESCINRYDIPDPNETTVVGCSTPGAYWAIWAPSESRIAYIQLSPNPSTGLDNLDLVTANPDGSDITTVIRNAYAPDWQPR
jgi:dipeptidyl aminopeptidase/acylaminoacyl peptidase